jgi:hypothetical protein
MSPIEPIALVTKKKLPTVVASKPYDIHNKSHLNMHAYNLSNIIKISHFTLSIIDLIMFGIL